MKQDLYIAQMDCADEVRVLEDALAQRPGIIKLGFDVLTHRMSVEFDANRITLDEIRTAIAATGLRADLWVEGHRDSSSDHHRQIVTMLSGGFLVTGIALQMATVGFTAHHANLTLPWWLKAVYLGAIITGAWYVIPRSIAAARSLRPDINFLMVVAVMGAIGLGDWLEAASVSFLFALSLWLERWSIGRANRAVKSLLALTPDVARVMRNDQPVELPIGEVLPGEYITVLPGERLPLDGVISQGQSWINQAPVTGESLPVSRSPGDDVFAGSINGDGQVIIQVSRGASDSLLARVGKLIEEARMQKSGHEQWVDRFARIYTPAVMSLAALFLILPPLLWGASWSASLYNALVLLVISCPCALVISTPVSIVAALSAAARAGVLIKGGQHVESPAHMKALLLDKTGTITRGELTVNHITPMAGHTEKELLEIALSLEHASTHPLARAIVLHAAQAGITSPPASQVVNLPGKGASGLVNGQNHWIGSHNYLEERQQETPEVHQALLRLAESGSSVVVIGNDQHVCGFLSLSDQLQPAVTATLHELRSLGVQRIAMLTGDNEPTGRTIARQAGITEVFAELLPEDKISIVRRITGETSGTVAMVGDGVNDAPAMAGATLGIAMGKRGTDVAMETADIVLMNDDLARLPDIIRLARRAIRIIRQNIILALSSKLLVMLLALLGISTLWMAIMADMGISLVAVFNALRLLNPSAFQRKGQSE